MSRHDRGAEQSRTWNRWTDQNRGTYQNRDAQQNRDGYRNRDAQQNRGAYQNRGAFQNRGSYQNRGTYQNRETYQNRGSYRQNDRVTMQGRVTAFNRDRNGYRVRLDRGPTWFWVPDAYFLHRPRLSIGLSIFLGGIFRDGSVYVDSVNWPDGYGYGYGNGYYNDGYVRGVVDRVDYRRDIVWLRDDRTGRYIEADMRDDRYGRLSIDDLRPGDYIELSGGWVRGDIFVADRIESVRDGRGRY